MQESTARATWSGGGEIPCKTARAADRRARAQRLLLASFFLLVSWSAARASACYQNGACGPTTAVSNVHDGGSLGWRTSGGRSRRRSGRNNRAAQGVWSDHDRRYSRAEGVDRIRFGFLDKFPGVGDRRARPP